MHILQTSLVQVSVVNKSGEVLLSSDIKIRPRLGRSICYLSKQVRSTVRSIGTQYFSAAGWFEDEFRQQCSVGADMALNSVTFVVTPLIYTAEWRYTCVR